MLRVERGVRKTIALTHYIGQQHKNAIGRRPRYAIAFTEPVCDRVYRTSMRSLFENRYVTTNTTNTILITVPSSSC
ncbi:MAG: hypothetical protein F6K56_15215 [Moorea sp. SIO3G5]|nr:hypothetical protein [Moorena sp. SIO3G5]